MVIKKGTEEQSATFAENVWEHVIAWSLIKTSLKLLDLRVFSWNFFTKSRLLLLLQYHHPWQVLCFCQGFQPSFKGFESGIFWAFVVDLAWACVVKSHLSNLTNLLNQHILVSNHETYHYRYAGGKKSCQICYKLLLLFATAKWFSISFAEYDFWSKSFFQYPFYINAFW